VSKSEAHAQAVSYSAWSASPADRRFTSTRTSCPAHAAARHDRDRARLPPALLIATSHDRADVTTQAQIMELLLELQQELKMR